MILCVRVANWQCTYLIHLAHTFPLDNLFLKIRIFSSSWKMRSWGNAGLYSTSTVTVSWSSDSYTLTPIFTLPPSPYHPESTFLTLIECEFATLALWLTCTTGFPGHQWFQSLPSLVSECSPAHQSTPNSQETSSEDNNLRGCSRIVRFPHSGCNKWGPRSH